MDFPLAEPVARALHEAVDRSDTGYAHPEAVGLAGAFAGFAERRFGWRVDPARVTSLPDVMGGVTELLRVLTEPGDGVVINPPVYHPFFSVIGDVGAKVVEVPLAADNSLDLPGIEAELSAGAKVVLLCHPHNPTGAVLARAQLEGLAAMAERHDAWVISDEIHAPLTHDPASHVPFITVSDAAAARGFSLVSASKSFNIAGLMCALAVTAHDTPHAQFEGFPFIATHPGHLGSLASVAAFNEGDEWLDDLRALLDHNRSLLADLLAEQIPAARYTQPEAGYLAWVDCRELGLGADPSEAFLDRGRVALSPGPRFGTQGEGFARLNIGTSPALVEEAVKRMASAL